MALSVKKVTATVINVAATVIIILAAVVLLRVVFTGGGQAPSFGGYAALRTVTGSMEPAIPENALIVVQEVDPATLTQGDVITFKSTDPTLQGNYNTHRITSVHQEGGQYYFRTKGDANAAEDQYSVPGANVLGKVIFVSGALGLVISLLTNPLVFFPLIVLPLVILAVLEVRKALKAAKAVADAEDEAALQQAIEDLRKKRALEQQDQEPQDQGPHEGEQSAQGDQRNQEQQDQD